MAEVFRELLDNVLKFRGASCAELTLQERRVLEHVAAGMTDKQIARILGLSPRTVHFHLSNTFLKLGVKGRLLAALAFRELEAKLTRPPPAISGTADRPAPSPTPDRS